MTNKKEILREYKDCSGLHILQEILSPNPPNGSYENALDDLLNLSKEKKIPSSIFKVNRETISKCKILQEESLIKFERKDSNNYKISLTKDGVKWLIRDRLEQLKRFDELNDEKVSVYLSNIKIEGDDYD